MAKKSSRKSTQQRLIQTWWVRVILALVFLLIGYGFLSLAFNSASYLEYALALIFLWWAAIHAVRAVRLVF